MRMLCGCPRGQLQAVEGAWLKFRLALRARYLSLTPPFRNPASATASGHSNSIIHVHVQVHVFVNDIHVRLITFVNLEISCIQDEVWSHSIQISEGQL